jgi:hypothetical protein
MGWDESLLPWFYIEFIILSLLAFFFDTYSFVSHFVVLFFHGKMFDIFSEVKTMKTKSDCVEFCVLQARLNYFSAEFFKRFGLEKIESYIENSDGFY